MKRFYAMLVLSVSAIPAACGGGGGGAGGGPARFAA